MFCLIPEDSSFSFTTDMINRDRSTRGIPDSESILPDNFILLQLKYISRAETVDEIKVYQ